MYIYFLNAKKIKIFYNVFFILFKVKFILKKIKGPLENEEHKNLFIATQGPMTSTIEAFWLMLINNNSTLIVTLSNAKEDGRVLINF